MDFASGLANLEQSAAKAQNRSNNSNNSSNNNDRRRPRDDGDQPPHHNERYQPRPRRDHHYGNSNHNSTYDKPGLQQPQQSQQQRYGNHRPQQQQQQQQQVDRSTEGLSRMGYRLPRGPYHRPPPIAADTGRPLHICLLAITIHDLPYEHIWKAWASSGTSQRYHVSLVCHAKHPNQVTSSWLQQRMLLQPRRIVRGNSWSEPEYLTYQPAWGSVEITRAMMDLLVTGMEMGRKGDQSHNNNDARFSPRRFLASRPEWTLEELANYDVPPADKFIFISETCLPVVTLDEAMQALFFNYSSEPLVSQQDVKKEDPKKEDTVKEDAPAQEEEAKSEEEPVATETQGETSTKDAAAATAPNQDDKNVAQQDTAESKTSTTTTTTTATTVASINTKTCIPKMMYLDVSWVHARNFNSPNTPSNKYERDQFNGIHKIIPRKFRWKADQWMCLSRTHAAAVLDLDRNGNIVPVKDQLWNSFRRINASDEMYFPTSLAIAGVLMDVNYINNRNNNNNRGQDGAQANNNNNNKEPTPQLSQQTQPPQVHGKMPWLEQRRVTYTDWSEGMRNPACFTKGIRDFGQVAKLARQQGCLLARKFAPFQDIPGQDVATLKRTGDISVQEWQQELVKLAQIMDTNK